MDIMVHISHRKELSFSGKLPLDEGYQWEFYFGSIEFHGFNLPYFMKKEKCPLKESDKSSNVIKTINHQLTVFGHFFLTLYSGHQ